jgi:hypothetical protein
MTHLTIPVGHYIGPAGSPPGGLAAAHRVRAGGRLHTLPRDPYTLWMLAHGAPPVSIADGAPWLTPERRDTAVADLAERHLLLSVDPESTDAGAFARAYRWNSMLHGHGMRPGWDGLYGIGAPDAPWILVDNLAHDLWRWAPVTPTLWDACETLAPAYRNPADDRDPTVRGPADLLPHLLRRLHLLVCSSAGYLDEAS